MKPIKSQFTLVPDIKTMEISARPTAVTPGSAPFLQVDDVTIAQHALANKKAQNVIGISLKGKTDMADALVIATGTSARHVAALAEEVVEMFTKANIPVLGVEGLPAGDWVIVDTGTIMVHIFQENVRDLYQLEKMWSVTFNHPDGTADNDILANSAA